ncbi:MAG: hypothetical protein IJW30_01185 [Clostridia bacterium]|nr:hypothetical protein [Clostridia bacterium]
MKKTYQTPALLLIALQNEDVLTVSGDNDAPFVKKNNSDDLINNGWSGFY